MRVPSKALIASLLMAEHSYLEPDFDFNSLQFLANLEMQTVFSDNLLSNCLMVDSCCTSRMDLPTDLIDETANIGGPDIFEEDANAYLAGELEQSFAAGKNVQQQRHSAIKRRSKSDLTLIQTGTCVLPSFSSNSAFVERGVQYASFGMENCQIAEESTLSTTETSTNGKRKERAFEQAISKHARNYSPLRKRETVEKAMHSYTETAKGKRWKGEDNVMEAVKVSENEADQSNNDICSEKTKEENSVKAFSAPLEKPNYIHVRARRGEATNMHSLAERARRKKISERMRFLQDLVPGCSKVTGRALILEEIINHVQALHRQVKFLSMKAITVNNPRFDIGNHPICSNDITTSRPPNSGISPDLMPSPYPQCEQPEQLKVCFERENPPPSLFCGRKV